MDKSLLKLERGTMCTSWNYSGQKLAAGSLDGTIAVFDARDPASSFNRCSRFKASPLARLHTRNEEEKNSSPLEMVVKGVLLQQLVQATVAHPLIMDLEQNFLGEYRTCWHNSELKVVLVLLTDVSLDLIKCMTRVLQTCMRKLIKKYPLGFQGMRSVQFWWGRSKRSGGGRDLKQIVHSVGFVVARITMARKVVVVASFWWWIALLGRLACS